MVAKPPPRRAGYEDVLAAPEHVIAEVLNGELVLQPRPTIAHQLAASELGADLTINLGRRGPPDGWLFLDASELHLDASGETDILVPNIAGWRRTRLPRRPAARFITLSPDWVCEVLSPSTELRDRTDKLQIYAREGVGHLWLVSVRTRHLEVYALRDGLWTLLRTAQGDAKVRLPPFEEVELALEHLWTDEDTSPAPTT